MAHHDSGRLTPQELRAFGATTGGAFLALAGVTAWRGHGALATGLAGLGGVLVIGGVLAPRLLRPVHRAWFAFAHLLSRVTTPIMMGILYFGLLTPIGLLRRLSGANTLRHSPGREGYWKKRPADRRQRRDMHHQF